MSFLQTTEKRLSGSSDTNYGDLYSSVSSVQHFNDSKSLGKLEDYMLLAVACQLRINLYHDADSKSIYLCV